MITEEAVALIYDLKEKKRGLEKKGEKKGVKRKI